MFNIKTLLDRKRDRPETRAGGSSSIPRSLTPFAQSEARDPPPVDIMVEASPGVETRGADRFVPNRRSTVLISDSGKKISARIINVSATGIALEADFSQIPATSIVMVGERKVLHGRKILRGTVFLFETPLPPHLCGPHCVL